MKKLIVALAFLGLACLPHAYSMPSYDDVLVVVNTQHVDSATVADYFIAQRNIPATNRCEVSIPVTSPYMTELCTTAQRDAVIEGIRNHLTFNGLTDKINYIVLSTYFPVFSSSGLVNPSQVFDYAVMHGLGNLNVDIFKFNPYCYVVADNYNNKADVNFKRNKYGYYIVSRLDGTGTATITKMIDNAGVPAFGSYLNGINFYHNNKTDFTSNAADQYGSEFIARGNINVLWRPAAVYGMAVNIDNITASYIDSVHPDGDATVYHSFPLIYRGLNYSPGGLSIIHRSYPNYSYKRYTGGPVTYDGTVITDYALADGSDLPFKVQTTVTYDPDNDWIWSGTGIRWTDITETCSGTDANAMRDMEASRGGGVVVYNKTTKALVAWYNSKNSPLINNAVYKVAYDKYHKRVWMVTHHGVQYFDCVSKTWSGALLPGTLSGPNAAAFDVFVDPYSTSKVYFTYHYYLGVGFNTELQGGEAKKYVFEYDKDTEAVVQYPVYAAGYGGLYSANPLMAKTAANIMWCVQGGDVLKYDLSTNTQLARVYPGDYFDSSTSRHPRRLIVQKNSSGDTYIYATYNDRSSNANRLLQIKETGYDTQSMAVITSSDFNNGRCSLAVNPQNPDELYLAVTHDNRAYGGRISKSVDGHGAAWSLMIPNYVNDFRDLYDINLDDNGLLYGGRGYYGANVHQNVSDFLSFGACATGGGMEHARMSYDEHSNIQITDCILNYWTSPYYAPTNSARAVTSAMTISLLDGYSMAEARFRIFRLYPSAGGLGYENHVTIFEPKCAPFAPRVDEGNTVFETSGQYLVKVKLFSPGLPSHMDGFIASTISRSTVSLTDDGANDVPASRIEYDTAEKEILYFTASPMTPGLNYHLTLKCGPGGIKNVKGAALVNTRADEFIDEVEYTFLGNGDNVPPVAFGGAASVWENTSVNIELDMIDPNGDPVTYAIVQQPVHGALSGTAPSLTYTPAADYYGADSFTWSASDGASSSNIAVVSIDVKRDPFAFDQTITTNEDVAAEIVLTAQSASEMAYTILAAPLHGTLSGTAPTLTYTPDPDYYGVDSFTWKANNGVEDSNEAMCDINITSVHDKPIAHDQTVSTTIDTPKNLTLTATLGDGEYISYWVITAFPSHGTLVGGSHFGNYYVSPNFVYTPNPGFAGSDNFCFKAYDDWVMSEIATVTVNVNPNTWTLTYTAGANGTVTGTTTQTVNNGADGTAVTAVADVGYHFVEWSDASTANPRIDTNVTADISVTANFAINEYRVEFSTDGTAGASLSGISVQTVTHGADCTPVEALPPAGYAFIGWTGGCTGAENPLTMTGVTGNLAVTATFSNVLTMKYLAGAGGFVTGATMQTVLYGQDGSEVVAAPDLNHHFVQWSDGVLTAARTDFSITGNVEVTANFAIDEYRVEFLTDGTAGASLSGILVQTVTHGADCTPVEALPPAGCAFIGWTGGYTGAENPLTMTEVTSALVVRANFHMQQVACGATFAVAAEAVNLTMFHAKPKVYATYNHPITGKPGKATAKVLTKIDKDAGALTILCEWTKVLRLYDLRAFKASEVGGIGAAGWITEPTMHDLAMDLRLSSKEVSDQLLQPLALAVPVIDSIADGGQDGNGNDTLVITGQWFGTKRLKVWREYADAKTGKIKHQAMKVVAPTVNNTAFHDSKLKPTFMDPATGESKAIVVVPAKAPRGTRNGVVVLENGVGLAIGDDPSEIP